MVERGTQRDQRARSWPITANGSWPSSSVTATMQPAITHFEYRSTVASGAAMADQELGPVNG